MHKLPLTYVSIGYAEPGLGGSDMVLNVAVGDPDSGKVFVWIKANDPWMTGDNMRGLGFVANSFNDFMNNLVRREALLAAPMGLAQPSGRLILRPTRRLCCT